MAAAALTNQVILDGPRNVVVRGMIAGGTTDLSNGVLVDLSTLSGSPTSVKVTAVSASLSGFACRLKWDATTDVPFAALAAGDNFLDMEPWGGIPNNAGAGVTGDVLIDTEGSTATTALGVVLIECKKKYD